MDTLDFDRVLDAVAECAHGLLAYALPARLNAYAALDVLTRKLEEIGRPTFGVRRILASSSVPLFDRVVDQLFSEPLYYRLNVIHIVISPNQRR